MTCKHCGREIGYNRFCPYCGAENETELITAHPYERKKDKTFGWAVLGFFFPIVGLILFLMWRVDKPKAAENAGIGALVGVVTGGGGAVVAVIVSLAVFGTVFGIAVDASQKIVGVLSGIGLLL